MERWVSILDPCLQHSTTPTLRALFSVFVLCCSVAHETRETTRFTLVAAKKWCGFPPLRCSYHLPRPDESRSTPESQRDSVSKPRVARHEQPWVNVRPTFPTATRMWRIGFPLAFPRPAERSLWAAPFEGSPKSEAQSLK